MLPDRVSNPGPLTYESGALPMALRGPAIFFFFESVFLVRSNRSNNRNVPNYATNYLCSGCLCRCFYLLFLIEIAEFAPV